MGHQVILNSNMTKLTPFRKKAASTLLQKASQNRKRKVTLILTSSAATWPSVSTILPELLTGIQDLINNIKTWNVLDHRVTAKRFEKDDFWIFPIGSVQMPILNWLSRSYKVPGDRPPAIFYLNGEGAKLAYHLWHFRKVFRPEDLWVVSCEAEKKLIDHWFPGNRRTVVAYYPVAREFRPSQSLEEKLKLRRKLNLPAREKILLYAGRISQQKNIIELFNLLQTQKKMKLLICGDIDSLGIPHLERAHRMHLAHLLMTEIGRRQISHRVEFRPYQSQIELQKIMRACDFQVSLSAHYGEDFGYSILQGLASGLKTILSRWGGHQNWSFLNEQVQWIDLDWSEEKDVGKPILKQNFRISNEHAPSFRVMYQPKVKKQLHELLNQMDSRLSLNSEHIDISTHPELDSYWESIAKKPRTFMFRSAKDRLFQKVIKAYQGHDF